MSAAFTRRLKSSALVSPSLRKIALMCFSTARLVRKSCSAIAWFVLPCAISERISSSRGVSSAERRRARPHARGDQRLDHLRVDDRAALGHRAQRRDELGAIGEPLLEQVRAAVGPALEQRERVLRRRVLAHDHDARSRGASRAAGWRSRSPRPRATAASGCRSARVRELGARPPRAARRRPRRSRRARARARPPSRCASASRTRYESSATTIRSGRSSSVVTAVPARSCAHRRKCGRGTRRPALAADPSMR